VKDQRTILITGVTGKQGGAVARELVGKGLTLRGMTRKPDSDAARVLAAQGVEIVGGDLDDTTSLERAVAGAWGVFAVQNTWEAGVEKEEEQGKRLARVAKRAGVEHYVYTSVGSAQRGTGIPHFDNKRRVEQTVLELGFPSHVIFRPVFFMENLTSPWFLHGDKLITALKPETRLQMIAVEDIGRFEARGFTDVSRFAGREIELAGDEHTMPEVAAIFSESLGRQIDFVQIPMADVRKNSEDFALMLEWFDRVGYNADIPALEKEFAFRTLKLGEWARTQQV
jgi:uncharacterized protein YbjT (DUF2867 family)